MAAVGCAARRLGGSLLQQTQTAATSPAIAEERRRLVTRLMHTNEHSGEDVLRQIQQKKKELYDMILKAEKNFMTSNWRNRGLLRHLSVQIDPMPHDLQWHRLRLSKRATNVVKIVGVITLTSMVATGSFSYQDFKDYLADRKKLPKAVKKKNQRSQEEASPAC
ncbi:unnamed protein product [Triticum aestivum]|uniref:Uncharacterized protein n=2 Tax=Triticum aestivum TaxID=4565 RepID=A0A9R1JE07_WHEAT|nr:uncharacterized protein LOC120973471 [Aegilops tauschii subsp. strangulata]XP_044327676.1 uncharacterized protein LOC123048696 [Triticum aestivum]KAF7014030.1 hypothetical protein CFC21_028060 [Triticum aestivum]SPT16316.1 unnamed protein product [Triticum aestivum]